MKKNMNDFFIYNQIGDQYDSDKKLLNKELFINTSFCEIDSSKNIVEQIYLHCFEEDFCYSWSYMNNREVLDYKINNDEVIYEEAIFEHCIVSTIYTVQYMLYNDIFITPSELGDIMECNGHNSSSKFGNKQKIKINEDHTEVEFLIDGIENNKTKKIKENLDELIINDKADYIGQTLGIDVNKSKKVIPLFLSNFSYEIFTNFNLFRAYELIEDVNNSPDSRTVNRKIKHFLDAYNKAVNQIYLPKNNDFCNTTNVDKLLFYYRKERLLHSNFIKFCINKCEGDNTGLLYIENTDEEIIKKCMMLPNVFSRNMFAERFSRNSLHEEAYYDTIDSLNHLLNLTFPIFEKTFFITLYEYCVINSKETKVKKILKYMSDILTKYIDSKIIKEKNYDELLASVNLNFDKYLIKQTETLNVDGKVKDEKKYNEDGNKVRAGNRIIENRSNIYELLKYTIENKMLFNKQNISIYKHPDVGMPSFIDKYNEKDVYIKKEVSRDYSMYLNIINSGKYSTIQIDEIMQTTRNLYKDSLDIDIEKSNIQGKLYFNKSYIEKFKKSNKQIEDYYKKTYANNSIKNRKSIFDDYIRGKPIEERQ